MNTFIRTIMPTRIEVMLYVFVSTFALITINLTDIASLFINPEVFTAGTSLAGERVRTFTTLIDNLSLTSTVALALFWALFGTAIYIIGATFYELLRETRHDLAEVAPGMVHHPSYLTSAGFAGQLLGRAVLRIVVLILMVAYIFLFIGFVVPLSSQLVRDVVFVRESPWLVFSPLVGVLLTVIGLHVFVVLLRLLFLRPRLLGASDVEGS
jgi:hypothetical protein